MISERASARKSRLNFAAEAPVAAGGQLHLRIDQEGLTRRIRGRGVAPAMQLLVRRYGQVQTSQFRSGIQ